MSTPTSQALHLDAQVPQFSLSDTEGHACSLETFAASRVLALVFLANHCPYVSAWEDRILAIARDFKDRDVAFVGISSNDVSKVPKDSLEEMRKRVEEKGYPFPYLFDEEQSVAEEFGATRTPEVFVFDADRRLRYHGAVDSDFEGGAGTEEYLRTALSALVAGQNVPQAETRVVGCTIKWKA
ncbi:MAG: thioredoxin family protein [Chloroflexota bacterium]